MTKVMNNLSNKYVEFVKIKNKWSEIYNDCCDDNCINTNKPTGNCNKGNGFGNLINDENIKYINCLEGNEGYDNFVDVYAENSFKNPQRCLNYSLYYFEVKCIFERNEGEVKMYIGLVNFNKNKGIRYSANIAIILNEKDEAFETPTPFNNNDIFGCGLVYPPTNMTNKFPYVFFTQNGNQIGKGILKDNFNSYKPYVDLYRCSIEANFGNNLESKPFNYDISKHSVLKKFY
ncbi:unnamed protein product [Meloidogyne enterolobii]|uniref:Uncharacterized protein n=1 Tax=Meloidogyne enterolobii TaxID=390850 RepID=A0ACB0YLI6_MELEN